MKKIELHWQILLAIVLAVIVGGLTGTETSVFGVQLLQVYDFAGSLFLNALTMLIVPLVVSTIIHGIGGISGKDGIGRLGGLTFGYFIFTSLAAALIGAVSVIVFKPGFIDGVPSGAALGLNVDFATTAVQDAGIEVAGSDDLVGVFLNMVPTNIVSAAADGQLLGLIFFSILFGYFMTRISEPVSQQMERFWHGIVETMMLITLWVMKFAPYGIFGIVATTAATTGLDAFAPLMKFAITIVVALAIHVFVLMPVLLTVVGKVSAYRHVQAMAPALLTAFSTSSSSATLPVTLECCQQRAGVSEETAGLVLPLGATVNMDGTAVYYGAAGLFLAQAYGLDITAAIVLSVVLISVVGSIAAPGIPGIPLILPLILTTLGLPLEAIALLFSIDRVMDMLRTATNVFGDTCGAVIIARLRGESGVLKTG